MITDPVRFLLNVPGVIELSCKKNNYRPSTRSIERRWSNQTIL